MRVRYIMFFFVGNLFFGCMPEEDRSNRKREIDLKVAQRVLEYKKTREKICRESLLKEANAIVDSILILEARLKIDSLGKPPKPLKPEKPTLLEMKDSSAVTPFFKDSTLRLER